MLIAIAGAHGQVARMITKRLVSAGHDVIGIIRSATQAADVRSDGARPLVLDLEHTEQSVVAAELNGVDSVIFAAGSGANSPVERSNTMDRDGAILFARAATAAGVRRFVMLSGAGADDWTRGSDDPFQVYLHAKADADAAVRRLPIDWVIVRPDALNDGPAVGTFQAGGRVKRSGIARADVADALADLATGEDVGRMQFELTTGTLPLRTAVRDLSDEEATRAFLTRRFSVRIPGTFEEVVARFERDVPSIDVASLGAALHEEHTWSAVQGWTHAHAPRGFLRYWRNDVRPLMAIAGDDSDCVAYLMGNHTMAERMFRFEPRVMNYAPLRVEITQERHDGAPVLFTAEVPSGQFASFDDERVSAVGEELDRELADLLWAMGAQPPAELLPSPRRSQC